MVITGNGVAGRYRNQNTGATVGNVSASAGVFFVSHRSTTSLADNIAYSYNYTADAEL